MQRHNEFEEWERVVGEMPSEGSISVKHTQSNNGRCRVSLKINQIPDENTALMIKKDIELAALIIIQRYGFK